jgi:hypothetical protein
MLLLILRAVRKWLRCRSFEFSDTTGLSHFRYPDDYAHRGSEPCVLGDGADKRLSSQEDHLIQTLGGDHGPLSAANPARERG